MDITHVLFLTLVYGTLAMIMSWDMGYGKYLSFALGTLMLGMAYPLHAFVTGVGAISDIVVLIIIVGSYFLLYVVIMRGFRHERVRELFACIATLGWMIFWENFLTLLYGPISVRREGVLFSPWRVSGIVFVLMCLVIFLGRWTYRGILYASIEDSVAVVRTLGVQSFSYITVMHGISYVLLAGIGLYVMAASQITPGDGLFYWIKAVGILVISGVSHRFWIYPLAALYVILEYWLFVYVGFPLQYKEGIMLLLIMLVVVQRARYRQARIV